MWSLLPVQCAGARCGKWAGGVSGGLSFGHSGGAGAPWEWWWLAGIPTRFVATGRGTCCQPSRSRRGGARGVSSLVETQPRSPVPVGRACGGGAPGGSGAGAWVPPPAPPRLFRKWPLFDARRGRAGKAADGMDRLVFDFTRDAWVEIKDGNSKIVFSRLGRRQGLREQVEARAPLSLVVGNALCEI